MGANLKVHETPSETVVKAAVKETMVTDPLGRVITLRKPPVLAQFRLIEVLGDTAENKVYTAMALPLIYVVAIDDDPVHQPSSKRELEALIQRLDEEGIAAVSRAVLETFGASPDPDKEKAQIRK
jgi:hypothetical protein